MARTTKPTEIEIIRRLAAIKLTVAGMKGAMPTMAAELRRSACESIDDLIEEVAR